MVIEKLGYLFSENLPSFLTSSTVHYNSEEIFYDSPTGILSKRMTGITASYCSTDSCFTVHRIHQGHYWTEEDSMFTVLSRLLTLCCYQSADAPARACLCLSIATVQGPADSALHRVHLIV